MLNHWCVSEGSTGGGTQGPPGPKVGKGDLADPNSGTNMARAAKDGGHTGSAAWRSHRESTPRPWCAGFPRVGALRAALAPCAPRQKHKERGVEPILPHPQGWLSITKTRMHLASRHNAACRRTVPAVQQSGQRAQHTQRVRHIRGPGISTETTPLTRKCGVGGGWGVG